MDRLLSSNVFESGSRRVIPAVLAYLECEGQVLMLERPDGKWNGLGGKLEKDESPLEAVQREIQEESGLFLDQAVLKPIATLQFPNFKPEKNEDWLVFVFLAEISKSLRSQVLSKTDAGRLHWVLRAQVLSLPLWPGDRLFLPAVFEKKPFMGTLWYQKGQVSRSWIQVF